MKYLLLFCSISFFYTLSAQNLSSKIVDAQTGQPIPFATVQYSEFNGVMSNEEGVFTIKDTDLTPFKDVLIISSLGYKKTEITFQNPLPILIELEPDIYEITPVSISSKNLTEKEILDKIKDQINENYENNEMKYQFFVRNSGMGHQREFSFSLKESTLENITQKLLDETFGGFKNKFVYLNEFVGENITKNQIETKLLIHKALTIQNKDELATGKKLQQDFMSLMKNNFKSDSNLIIKTGIIRLDKTETIDSISKKIETNEEDRKKNFTERNTNKINTLLSNLFIHEKSDVDFIHKSNKYEFTKKGFASYEGNWVYVLEFVPKGSALYKGKIYVDAESFAVVKAEFEGANPIFDEKINMFGISANALKYKSIVIFNKSNVHYNLKYLLVDTTDEVIVNRPLTIVEKNDNVNGKKRINKVEVQMKINTINYERVEMVFDNPKDSNAIEYAEFTPNLNFETTKKSQYDNEFWKGYNILTPEKAIQELKIED